MGDRETSMRPTPSDAAILQSRGLRQELLPPPIATSCDRPPVSYIINNHLPIYDREAISVEGPCELETISDEYSPTMMPAFDVEEPISGTIAIAPKREVA